MVLRSDEAANQAEIERDQRFRSNVNKGVATAATLAGAGASAGIASKIAPFLSKYVPVDLAIKGISKVSPRAGEFLKKGQEMGLNVEEGMNFIKEKLGATEKAQTAKQNKNIIEQYSPELFQFIEQEIKRGRSPIQAAALAQMDIKGNKFSSVIKKMTQDHKTDWSAIVESVFGGEGGQSQPNQPQNQPQQPNPQGQGGPGQQALMDILNKINQRLG